MLLKFQVLSLQILGGKSLYSTGVTILESSVELIKPPISTIARGEISGLVLKAIGISPPIAVIVVNTMGRKRISPDF
jgi:hypothetical protein